MKNILTLLLLSFFFFQCFGQVKSISIPFVKEIPTWKDGSVDLSYNLTQQKVKQLKIEALQSGYDSIQIRIWYDYSLSNLQKLLIIKRSNSKWTAMSYRLNVKWDYLNLTDSIVSYDFETLSPNRGWNSFINDIFSLQIQTLPDMNHIPELFDGWCDGVTYSVEIANMSNYRFYSYHLPEEFQDKFWQAKNMVSILNLIKNDFGISWGY